MDVKVSAAWNPENVIKDYVLENYPWREAEIRKLSFNSELPAELPLRIYEEKKPPGKAVFIMEFKDGKRVKAFADVRVFDTVVMSRRAFKKGHSVSKEDIYVTLMDISRIPQDAVKMNEQAAGKQLTRSVLANMPLTYNMLTEARYIVRKGQRVTLLAESSGFSITTTGEIRENASPGSYVKVVNLASNKVVTGRLIDESTVRVEF